MKKKKPPETDKQFDCIHYDICLSAAAKANSQKMPCANCLRYSPTTYHHANTTDVIGTYRLALKIFNPSVHDAIYGNDGFATTSNTSTRQTMTPNQSKRR